MNDPLETMLAFAAVGRVFTGEIERLLGEYHGISLRDLDLMMQLQDTDDLTMTIGDLAKRLDVAGSDIIRILVPLENIGVTLRERDPGNPRNTKVVLTETGDTLTDDAHVTAGEATMFEFNKYWTTEQQDQLLELLSKVPTRGES